MTLSTLCLEGVIYSMLSTEGGGSGAWRICYSIPKALVLLKQ